MYLGEMIFHLISITLLATIKHDKDTFMGYLK